MINTTIECDKCKTEGTSIREHNFMAPLEAKRLLMNEGWAFREYAHLCPECKRKAFLKELKVSKLH